MCSWSHRRGAVAIGAVLLLFGGVRDPATAAGCPDVVAVVAALFSSGPPCDADGDGRVTAADITFSILVQAATPTPTITETSTETPTPAASDTPAGTATITPTPSITGTPTQTLTPTPRLCPTSGAALEIEIDNQTGVSPIDIELTGARTQDDCVAGSLNTTYDLQLQCDGSGLVNCGTIGALASGRWRHSLRLVTPPSGQAEHRISLLLSGGNANRLSFTAFRSVMTVTTAANTGDGSLRAALQAATAATKPLLIQFDSNAFPPGVPTTIALQFQLTSLDTDEVTIDGIDAAGAAGNRIIDAGGASLGIPALVITGGHNHVIGMGLRNAGSGDRDVLSISGTGADANLVEQCVIENAASGDGIGVDQGAGKDFADTVNIIRDCDVSGAADKGVKVTTNAYARVEHSYVHDNRNGGIQATLGGHVQAWDNVVERNLGATAQNGISVNASDTDPSSSVVSELETRGNISWRNGANGISVRAGAVARVRDDYLAQNLSSGIRVFNDVGPAASADVEGTSAVCNAVDGAVVADTSVADFGGGPLDSSGNNAFTQNNLPIGGANLRNATGEPISAVNDQWENCGHETTCNDAEIERLDITDVVPGTTSFVPAQAHRSGLPPLLDSTAPASGSEGELLRIFGSGFNVIDGHFSEKDNQCADVEGRNRCPVVGVGGIRGNCVEINGVSAPVEAVTPTMLVVRLPFTCIEPVPLIVKTDQGPDVAVSDPITVCTNP